MIDRVARESAANLADDLFSGRITNFDFMKRYPRKSADPALAGVYGGLWFYWDERSRHYLTDKHAPTEGARALADRCIQFLRSDLEYGWPPDVFDASTRLILLRLLGLRTAAARREDAELQRLKTTGDLEAWPFLTADDARASAKPIT